MLELQDKHKLTDMVPIVAEHVFCTDMSANHKKLAMKLRDFGLADLKVPLIAQPLTQGRLANLTSLTGHMPSGRIGAL